MAPHNTLQSEPYGKPHEPSESGSVSLENLSAVFAAETPQPSTADLDLSLLLNEVAKMACVTTPAAASAIALKRGTGYICRATTGPNAPSLGAGLNVSSGLSGLCIETRQGQRCDDTETDPRVDASVCRRLRIRSLLVLPLLHEGELLGLIEVFSPLPQAFSERDFQTLYALSRKVVESFRQSSEIRPPAFSAGLRVSVSDAMSDAEPAEKSETESSSFALTVSQLQALEGTQVQQNPAEQVLPAEISQPEPVWQPEPMLDPSPPSFHVGARYATAARSTKAGYRGLKLFLVAALTVLALFFGWMLGRLGSRESDLNEPPAEGQSQPAAPRPPMQAAIPDAQTSSPSSPVAEEPLPPAETSDQTLAPAAEDKTEEKTGPRGLAVYEKGKLIFEAASRTQLKGGSTPNAADDDRKTPPPRLSPEAAGTYLLDRVEPQYPEAARQRHLQGAVVFDVLVGSDGSVQEVKPLSGDAQLSQAAADAILQWRFKPYAPAGKPVEFLTRLTVNFVLN